MFIPSPCIEVDLLQIIFTTFNLSQERLWLTIQLLKGSFKTNLTEAATIGKFHFLIETKLTILIVSSDVAAITILISDDYSITPRAHNVSDIASFFVITKYLGKFIDLIT